MCCFSQLYYMQKDRCKSVPMIPHIDLLISPWFVIRITWSLHCWIALIKYCLSYTNHHFPFVIIDKLFSNYQKVPNIGTLLQLTVPLPCSIPIYPFPTPFPYTPSPYTPSLYTVFALSLY